METYRKVYIKSEADLPEEGGYYFCGVRYLKGQTVEDVEYYNAQDPDIKKSWLQDIDWYLQPIETTDADIEAWAEETTTKSHIRGSIREMIIKYKIESAKAALNNEIKHK